MRIIFMGTPDFAVASLKALIDAGENVVGVITAPDKPAGRGRKLQQSAVKKYALEQDLRVMQPTNLKAPAFVSELEALKPDLQVVVAFRMLPEVVWRLPARGTINLHASLLPQYRGAAPINWAIINGETETGVSTFFINENIDTGNLIMQEKVEIDEKDTAGSLHDKLMNTGAGLLVKTVKAIGEEKAPSTAQVLKPQMKTAPKIFKEDTHIDFSKDVKDVYNFIRGLSPYPAAYGILKQDGQEVNMRIYEVDYLREKPGKISGRIETDNKSELKIACENGWIIVKSLQIAGKKRMQTRELLNGFSFSEDTIMS